MAYVGDIKFLLHVLFCYSPLFYLNKNLSNFFTKVTYCDLSPPPNIWGYIDKSFLSSQSPSHPCKSTVHFSCILLEFLYVYENTWKYRFLFSPFLFPQKVARYVLLNTLFFSPFNGIHFCTLWKKHFIVILIPLILKPTRNVGPCVEGSCRCRVGLGIFHKDGQATSSSWKAKQYS